MTLTCLSYRIIFLAILNSYPASCSPAEGKLVRHLLQNYEPLARPVLHEQDMVTLVVTLDILQVLEVNEKLQTLKTSVHLHHKWTDINLQWNSSDYSNITAVRIPISKIWYPDLYLYNIADESSFASIASARTYTNAIIGAAGDILFVPQLLLTSSCRMDVTWFPFDTQVCELQFGSWTYSGILLDLKVGETIISKYVENGQWLLRGLNGTRIETMYEGVADPYLTIHFTLRLKRRVLYYFFNLIVPSCLIGFLALLGFTIPPDSGEKLTLGVTVLFSLIVFLNMIAETMPASSDHVPLLGTYFNCVMFMIASSMVSTVFVNVYRKSILPPKRLTGIPRYIFLCLLPKLLCILQPAQLGNDRKKTLPLWIRKRRGSDQRDKDNKIEESGVQGDCKKEVDWNVQEEWKYAALVLDRFCLAISILFAIFSFLAFLRSALVLY